MIQVLIKAISGAFLVLEGQLDFYAAIHELLVEPQSCEPYRNGAQNHHEHVELSRQIVLDGFQFRFILPAVLVEDRVTRLQDHAHINDEVDDAEDFNEHSQKHAEIGSLVDLNFLAEIALCHPDDFHLLCWIFCSFCDCVPRVFGVFVKESFL